MQHISPSWHCGRNTRRGPSHRLKTNLLCLAALFLFALMPSVGWAQATRSVSNAVAFRAALEDPNVTQITIAGNFTLERGHEATDLNGKKAYYNSIYIVQGTKTINGDYHTIYRGTSYRNNTILLGVGAVLTINNLTFDGSNYVNFAPMFCTDVYPVDPTTNIPVNGQLIMNNVTIKDCVSIDPEDKYYSDNIALSAVPDNSYLINPFHPNTSNRLVNSAGQPVNAYDYAFIWRNSRATGGAAIKFSPHQAASGNANNKITLTSCTFQNNKVQKNVYGPYTTGGAIFLGSANSKGGTFTGCRFEGNRAGDASVGQGGAIYFSSTLPINTEFWFSGTTVITSNFCGNDGGGILIEGGKVVIDGKTDISYNKAESMGGGIMLKGGWLYFQSSNNDDYVQIHHNEAGYGNGNAGSGGGICVSASEGTKLELSNNFSDKKVRLTISDNTCKGRLSGSTPEGGYGGGISIMTDGGSNWILVDHKVELVSTSTNPNDTKRILISNNEAYYDGNYSKSNGGGISVAERAVATFTKCIIEGNKAEGNGGGIHLRGSSVTFNGCLIENNYAWSSDGTSVYGGGVSVEYNIGNNQFIGGIIKNNGDGTNGTTTYGGGVSIVDGKVVFDGNDTDYGPCYIQENKASDGGGGLYMDSDNGKLIGGCHVGDNTAINGGGIYYKKGGFENTNYVYSNTATTNGGGVYVGVSKTNGLQGLVIGSNDAAANVDKGNKARNGGGVYTYSSNGNNHCITINNCKIVYNKKDATNATIATGGGLCMANQGSDHSHTVELTGGTIIDHNEAVDGGGVYVTNGGTLTLQLTNATLSNNKATAGNGGGIYNDKQTVTSAGATNIVIKGNEALAGNGGGLYNDGTTAFNAGTTTFENNDATNGGGIYNNWQVTQAEGSTLAFVNNTATRNGGGVYHSRGTDGGAATNLTLNGATFKGNHAELNGGGIYTDHTCILNGCQIGQSGDGNGNSALNGGGIYKRGLQMLTISGGEVSNNTASNNGGGIYLESGTDIYGTYVNNNCHIEGNKATNDGGGIYLNGQHGFQPGNYGFSSCAILKNDGVTEDPTIELAYLRVVVNYPNNEIKLIEYGEVGGTVNIGADGKIPYLNISYYIEQTDNIVPGDDYFLLRLEKENSNAIVEVKCKVDGYDDGWPPFIGPYYYHNGTFENPDYIESVPEISSLITLNGCTVGNGNEAVNGKGGGIYISDNATANLSGSNVQSNTAGTFGGGVYISSGAIMGVSGVVEVENNTTQRNTADYPYLKGSLEDDVCLQSLNWIQANNTNIGAGGNIGKIYVHGDITGSYIGITEEQIAIGPDNDVSNTDRLHNYEGDIHRQFTINYGTFYNAKNATEIFFSNDKILDIKRLYPGPNNLGQTVTSTTDLLEVTLGLNLNAWYVAGIWDDGNEYASGYKWGLDHPDYGRFPDIPLRTLTGPNGVFARGYNPHTDHIFVVRAISIEEEAKVRTTGDDNKVIIRYPEGWNQDNFAGNDQIPNEEGSLEVTLHRYPGGHRLSSAFDTNVYDSNTSNSGGGGGVVPSAQTAGGTSTANNTLKPGPNIGPVVQMDASNTTILYDVHMDGLAEFDHVENTSHNPQGFYISPKSALLAVEDVTYSNNTTPTGTITLKETCELLWNNNKYGSDNSKEADGDAKFKREQRTGGAVFCAGTLVCEGTVIERNTCIDITSNTTNGRGGGIYVKPGGSVTLDGCIVGSEGDAGIDETNKNMAQYGGGIYIDNTQEKTGVVILTGQNAIQHNEATVKGGGVYKLGRLMIQDGTTNMVNKPLHITKNNIVSGTGANITYTLNNVHIPIESADEQTILITGALNCGSSVGVTKTKKWDDIDNIPYGTQGEHTYKNDKYFEEVNTPIAKVDSWEDDDNDPSTPSVLANETWAEDAFYKRIFFDDKGYYRVWSFDFYNYGDGEDYSDQKDYFIETWRSYANNGTDHVELDNNNKLVKKVKSPQGFAYFAKQVNDGEDYSGVDLCQTTTIDLDGHHWEPIGYTFCGGCETEADRPFAGTYNGNGHFILNAVSILPEKEMGLFGNVTGTLKHTFTVGDDFSNTHDHTFNGHGFASLGAIVGNTTGIIDGCEAAKSLLHVHYHDNNAPIAAGGIAGNVGGTGEVRNSFTSHINFSEDKRQNGTITIAYGTFDHCGGLVGNIASGGKVKNCYTKVNGSAELFPESYAAIVGNNGNTQSGNFTNCYTSATEGAIVGSGTAGTNVYSAGATGATATYTAPIGADHLGYMCIDNGVPYSTCGLTTAQKENLIEGKDYFEFHDGNGNVTLIPLFRLLNLNAKALNNSNNYTPYAEWARPALAFYEGLGESASTTGFIERPVNGDLPLLMLNNYDGSTSPKIGQGGFRSVGTYGGPGDVLQYGGPDRDGNNNQLNAALIRAKVSNSFDDFLFVYGDVNVAPIAQCSTFTQAKVSIYEHAAVSSPGTLAGFDQTYVGITFDNSAQAGGSATNGINYIDNGPSLPRNWHMLSTPLTNAPLGFRYGGDADPHNKPIPNHTTYTANHDADGFFNNPWGNAEGSSDPNSPSNTEFSWLGNSDYATGHTRYWMHGWNNSRVAGTHDNSSYPASTWKDGYFPSKVNTSAIQFGAQLFIPFENNNGSNEYVNGNHRYPYGMDFYSWYEPKYHYINFKRNGPNHWHSNAPHVHLDYTPEEASNNSGATAFGQNVNETTLLDGKGYMASIHIPTFLQTSGSLGGSTKTIKVTYNENDLDLCEGWNLVGNPFHAYLDFNAFSSANSAVGNQYVVYNADGFGRPGNGNYGDGFSYYVAGSSQHGAYASQYLHPHQGFFVKVSSSTTLNFAESQTVLRSQIGTSGSYRDDSRPAYPLVNLFLTSDKGCSDVCVVEFNRPEWGGATKLRDMYSGNGLFYAAHDNGNYAALFATPEAERIPLKFEAKDEAGDTYTFHWNTQNGDFHKLYLVDNITGVQYDMLRNSSYSFSGKKGDYWTRFYITFEVTGLDEEQEDEEEDDASTGSASTIFAFFDGSQWVVTNDGQGTATLDLIDLQGRVLHSTTLAEGQARIGLPDVAKGMYLMRMTNQNGMFVQKIVVR